MSKLDAAGLESLVLFARAQELADSIENLGEAERRALSKGAWSLHRAIEIDKVEPPAGASVWRRGREGLLGPPMMVRVTAQLAVLGVCPESRWRQVRFWYLERRAEHALLKILSDRRAPWLGDWIDSLYDREERPPIQVDSVLGLVRAGHCDRPVSDAWVRTLARQKIGWWQAQHGIRPLHERLLAEPDVLEKEAWRLFEIESTVDIWYPKPTMASTNKPAREVEGWAQALLQLADDGHMERARLLDASLSALASPQGTSALSPLRRFHQDLKPVAEEIAERQDAYRLLLGSRTGSVVGLALKMLGRLLRGAQLEIETFLAAIPPIFELPAKAQPLSALRLLKRIAASGGSEIKRQVGAALSAGLFHPQADVQAFAADLLIEIGESEATSATIEPALPSLPLAVAERLAAAFDLELRIDDPDVPTAEQSSEISRRLAELGPQARRWAGLDEIEAGDGLPKHWDPPYQELEFLPFLEPIEPIRDWRELLDAAAHAVEKIDSADEVERLLDGLARWGGDRPPELIRASEALRQRLTGDRDFSPSGLGDAWGGVRLALRQLIETWLFDRVVRTWNPFQRSKLGPFPFICRRLDEVAVRLLKRRSDPLLAAPTHRGGWIAPLTWVERLRQISPRQLDAADFMQALLRLAPDGRAEALAAAQELGDWSGPVVRFALGEQQTMTSAMISAATSELGAMEYWLAAARSRAPRESARSSLAAFGELKLTLAGAGGDALEPTVYRWRSRRRRQTWFETVRYAPHVDLWTDGQRLPGAGEGFVPAQEQASGGEPKWQYWWRRIRGFFGKFEELPTSALHRLGEPAWPGMDQQTEWQVEWATSVWPAQTDAVLAAGVSWMMRRLDTSGSNAAPDHAYISSLFDIARPWSEVGYLAVSVAALSLDSSVKGAAVDALIEAIEDGRCQAQPLGEVLARLWLGDWAKANRLASTFQDIARVSPLHELIVGLALDRLIGSWQDLPHGAHHLLALLVETFTGQGLVPDEPARRLLAGVAMGGKTGKLVKTLLALEPRDGARRHKAAILHALRSRIERAEGRAISFLASP